MTGELESALSETERDARATQVAAERTTRAARQIVAAAVTGDIVAMKKAIADAEQAAVALTLQLENTRQGWNFDVQEYAENHKLQAELRAAAEAEGLAMHEQDGLLFCFPSLVRVHPGDPAVQIDRKKSRNIRPSYVLKQLKVLRTRPQRFSAEQFLELLFKAYEWARRAEGSEKRSLDGAGPFLELVTLFELITLFPGVAKDYDRAEFTRDLYLLDRSAVVETRRGMRLALTASSGTRGAGSKLLQIVDEDGRRKEYYAISFSAPTR